MGKIKKNVGKEITSPLLKSLKCKLKNLERAEVYLEKEKEKIVERKAKTRKKIKSEKEVIRLRQSIKKMQKKMA